MKLFNLLSLFLIIFSCQSQQEDMVLDAVAFHKKVSSASNALILDVRTPEEYNEGAIANSQNINYNDGEFKNRVNKLDKNKTYFVYCLSGGRSSSAASFMRSNGFKSVYELKGGILAWRNNNLPLASSVTGNNTDKILREEYKKLISSDSLVLVDFYAPWCAPCKKLEPILNQIAEEKKGNVKVIRLNIDENKQLAKELHVEEIPILKLFKNGEEQWTHKGFLEKDEILKKLPD